jgi:hypothetical protein
VTAAIGPLILAAAGIWLFAGMLARLAGILLVLAGALELTATGQAGAFLPVVAGALLWLAGHLHYRVRFGFWKSALAEHICLLLFAWHHPDDAQWREDWAHDRDVALILDALERRDREMIARLEGTCREYRQVRNPAGGAGSSR